MLEKVKVTGVKWFQDSIDGKAFDTGTAFIEERLDESKGRAKGYACTPYRLGSAALAQVLAKREMPLVCEVEFDRVTNGKETQIIIADIRPLGEKSPPVAKAA
ncbi:hypothetical protein [Stenotrophobium rhamnosiphilum]|uniref:Uncharacterized protein n=1 Tax=Stenotrophobium rhamnosiphilum TaxID=2029166 RepID=A0A2T5MKD9_9GAMM|nr:hypothetical protein [Stenotrophobium rhamnosiphilum]PTU33035.1 hypothetical protein CJD38_02695 [Stenotrophobium rhamnosiphilum]